MNWKPVKDYQPLWIGVATAVVFWLFDSVIHQVAYGEPGFEMIPITYNELWMRFLICMLFMAFGWYATIWNLQRRLENERDKHQRTEETLTDVLGEFVTLCSNCKQIKKRDNQWTPIESFIDSRVQKRISHGLCPSCAVELYPELMLRESELDG